MGKYIYFGESVTGYDIPVINEREARAGAGILLIPAMISFLNAYLTHDFIFTKIFVTYFMIDFSIRILINPKYAPSLILGRLFVQNQTPEYVGAPQKRFAWYIGWTLSIVMFVIIVILEFMTSIKIGICILCIVLLFSETSFGICLGCIMYHKIYAKSPKYCPGNVCEVLPKEEIQKVSSLQLSILLLCIVTLIGTSMALSSKDMQSTEMKCQAGKCGGNM